MIQITGRWNYQRIGNLISLPLGDKPDQLELPENAALSAAYFWKNFQLSEIANDNTNESFNLRKIRERINGGQIGSAERVKYWNRVKLSLGINLS